MMEWKSLNLEVSPVDVLSIFKDEPYVFLLESSMHDRSMGRFSFIGFDPFDTVVLQKGVRDTAIEALRKKFNIFRGKNTFSLSPFPAGIMGYLSYDFGLPLENIDSQRRRELSLPDYFFGFYDAMITIDHLTKKLIISSSGHPEKKSSLRKRKAKERLKFIEERLTQLGDDCLPIRGNGRRTRNGRVILRSNFSKRDYFKTVNKALDYIRKGDIYQVNLSQRFTLDATKKGHVDPFLLYKLLGELSPSCFGGYFDCGDFQLVSSSPERFLSLRGDHIETRPMKGTRPRGKNKSEDLKRKKELWESAKDKAELLMITDLERNDLGRVCEYGSVKIKNMRTLEEYKTVFQATSTIEGKLSKDKDCFDLLGACFPGGSVTGCPKIRAMQIIDELEPSPRSIYTGSLGYISFAGDMDFNILIRTLLVRDKKIYFHVGGGIVADSTPENEYSETLVKAKAMQECLEKAFQSA